MIKLKALLKMKKMSVPTKSCTLSKAKQVTSDECGKSRSCKKKRTRIEDLYYNDEAKLSVTERTENVLKNIGDECPSFTKCMLPSNVSHGFWLIFPKRFCNLHLPMHDATITLLDECGKQYETNYLVDRHGLSAGWRGFSLSHRILKGDILVFQLIKPCILKVHILRVYGLDEVDAALCLVNLVAPSNIMNPAKKIMSKRKRKRKKNADTLLQDISPRNGNENDPAERSSKHALGADQAKTNSNDLGFEVLEVRKIRSKRKAKENVKTLLQVFSPWNTYQNDPTEHSCNHVPVAVSAKTDSDNLESEVSEGSEISDDFITWKLTSENAQSHFFMQPYKLQI